MVRSATLTSFELANEHGALAKLGAALAVEDVTVLGWTLCAREAKKTVHVVTEQPEPPLAMLEARSQARLSREVLVVELTDGVRRLGSLGRRLAEADVNVEASLSLDEGPPDTVAVAVDEPDRARKVLEAGEAARPTA